MKYIGGVNKLHCIENLIEDVLYVSLTQWLVARDDSIQVTFIEIGYDVEILEVLCVLYSDGSIDRYVCVERDMNIV